MENHEEKAADGDICTPQHSEGSENGGSMTTFSRLKKLPSLQRLRRQIASWLNYVASFRRHFSRSRGSILIEFAFSIPTLLAILYYVLDYPKYEQLKVKTKSSAYMAASMIQNVSRYRESKMITLADIQMINYASFLNYYCGKQHLKTTDSNTYPLGHFSAITLICVQGVANNKCKAIWSLYASGWNAESPLAHKNTLPGNESIATFHSLTGLQYQHETEVIPTSIHPDLQIQEGENKIILVASFCAHTNFKYADGTMTTANPKRLFGFYMLPLRLPLSGNNFLFRSTIIFTPNPGLFSETPPS
jgi:hypothetical protein